MEMIVHARIRCVDVNGEEVDLAWVVAGVFAGDLPPDEFEVTLDLGQPSNGRED